MPEPVQTPTAEEIAKKAEEYRCAVVNEIVPRVIVDRLVRKHGFVIKNEAEVNKIVNAAVELFYMKQAGLISDMEEAEDADSPLVKAANEVASLSEKLRQPQYDDTSVANHFLGNQDLMNAALGFVQTAA